MTLDHAGVHAVRKPWGDTDLRPWSSAGDPKSAIGELWFERADNAATAPSLLLKLLFTTQPLSVQVHPDDAFAHSHGLPNGKSEAWYILSAKPGARIAIGLKRPLKPSELRAAIADGSISQLVQWRTVVKDDVISIPAGTIHAIGAGLVLAEIQQRSDTTFRMFDYGRGRELHADSAVAVADIGPPPQQPEAKRLSDERTLLIANSHFAMERIILAPHSVWTLRAPRESWMLALEGEAKVHSRQDNVLGKTMPGLSVGRAIFMEDARVVITAGADGIKALLAYVASSDGPDLVQFDHNDTDNQNLQRNADEIIGAPLQPVLPLRPEVAS